MSEPRQRRTRSKGFESLWFKALSLCVVPVLAMAVAPQAAMAQSAKVLYSIESAKAQSSLLVGITNAGKRLVSVGDRGHILYSDDNGASWLQAKVPTRQMLTAVYFIDDKHGWAVGHDAQILVSTDGGATWTRQFENLKREAPLLDIWFQNRQHGLAVGAYGALLETTDGGQQWSDISERLDNADGYHLNAIAAVKDAGLVVVGEQGVMFRSADWGQTWETLSSPYEGSLFGVMATGERNSLLAYGLRGHLFRSADFGDSWQQVTLPTAHNGLLEFGLSGGKLLADGTLLIVGHGGTVLRSTDHGRSFKVFNRSDHLSLVGVAGSDNGNLILVGQGGVHHALANGADAGQQQ